MRSTSPSYPSDLVSAADHARRRRCAEHVSLRIGLAPIDALDWQGMMTRIQARDPEACRRLVYRIAAAETFARLPGSRSAFRAMLRTMQALEDYLNARYTFDPAMAN